MTEKPIGLDDKYDLDEARVFVTGYQALVRLCLMQRERDRRAGRNTAGYVTGYRGSPLGGLDQQFVRAKRHLEPAGIVFQPGLNEDIAATAVWGSQQAELRGEGKYDGVFALWYGKGPGVDRSGDVMRHANLAGSSQHGGVVALMGDDHAIESSTAAHQSEFRFIDVGIPILNPAGVQEILDYGQYGWALSRFCGVWTALKCVKDAVESTAIVDGRLERLEIVTPADFSMPDGGLNIRLRDPPHAQEARLHEFKRDAILAFLRANRINRTVGGNGPARVGIVTTGKSYLDVRQALAALGIDETPAAGVGLRLCKVGCAWPLVRDELRAFAAGLDLIIVVEEKRALIEAQVREELYATANHPLVIGKKDERDNWLFPIKGALDPSDIAVAVGERLMQYGSNEALAARLKRLKEVRRALAQGQEIAVRMPYFCSGCPHNSSTVVPEGMRAYAGIGCHYMAQWMDRSTLGFTQMGGEGANWIGEAPFSNRAHVFQNIGDGTYNHSGYLAIRAAAAAGVNITYKILFNDAVAMTGGQRNEGGLDVPAIARQVVAEGAKRVAVVTDEPGKYPRDTAWPAGLTVHHRDDLMQVQTGLAAIPGLTVLIYDQTCAAEKRRRRKRGLYPDPDKRVVINELVCEGCGDCSRQSNCVSVQPLETEFGRKRTIDQSNCNKDFSCLKGFCPAFVTVHGAKPKRGRAMAAEATLPALPEPARPAFDQTYNILVTGIGGTGIVTVAGVLGMAAHLDGMGFGAIDMAGLAQKGGAVSSHIRIARRPEDIQAIRIGAGEADLVLGGDLVVTGAAKVLATLRRGATQAIVNSAEILPGDFTQNPDFSLPSARLRNAIASAVGHANCHFLDITRLAAALLGDSIGANMLMVGYACQLGALPLSAGAIEQAIALNGAAAAMNTAAFRWGRAAAVERESVESLAGKESGGGSREVSSSLSAMIARRVEFLTAYQNAGYAERYRRRVEQAREVEAQKAPGQTALAQAVARHLFKLMAYKDEYEVARLYSDGSFERQVKAQLEGADMRFEFHLAPPSLARFDRTAGPPKKRSFGPSMLVVFRMLARLKFLRGTAFDPFGFSVERRTERQLIADYEQLLDEIFADLTPDNHRLAVALAEIPEKIRGFGHVKAAHIKAARVQQKNLLEQFRKPVVPLLAAAE
jgi:indolepyruvate ferredoxin oxidoreductase